MRYTSEVDFVVQGMTSTTHATLKALEHILNFMLPGLSPNDKGRPCNHVRCQGLAVGALMHLLGVFLCGRFPQPQVLLNPQNGWVTNHVEKPTAQDGTPKSETEYLGWARTERLRDCLQHSQR